MKDKLRELAKDLAEKEKGNAPFERRFSEELLAILDAEGDGDGGAVPAELFAWLTERDLVPDLDEDGSFDMRLLIEALNEHENELQATHPARSGVVSEEDVEAACIIAAAKTDATYPWAVYDDEERERSLDFTRAALEHFAAIAQEKQS